MADNGVPEPSEVMSESLLRRAHKAVSMSLARENIAGHATPSDDGKGRRIDVEVESRDLEAAKHWLAAFGRSYGAVRIFVREAP